MESGQYSNSKQSMNYLNGSSNQSTDQQVMINVTRGSNLQLIPLTEAVTSPKGSHILGSPINNLSSMLMLEHQNSLSSKQSSQMLQRPAQYSGQNIEGLPLSQLKHRLQSEQLTNQNMSSFLNSFEGQDSISQNLYREMGTVSDFIIKYKFRTQTYLKISRA